MIEVDEPVQEPNLSNMKCLSSEDEEYHLLRTEEFSLSDIEGSIMYGRRLSDIRKSNCQIAQTLTPPKENQQSKQVRNSIVDCEWKVPPRYQMKRQIASGSYGSVMEAYDTKTETTVAIKRIRFLFKRLEITKLILREIALLTSLKGAENVIQILDICVPDDLENFDEIYLVFEYAFTDLRIVLETDLSGDMVEQFRVDEKLIQRILYNILTGLRVLHSAGIIHRDLKPSNCLVTDSCVKMSDFGMFRKLKTDDLDDMRLYDKPYTTSQRLIRKAATRWCRAPELLLKAPTYSAAIDIWSVGCIFAELLGLLEVESHKKGHLYVHPEELLQSFSTDLEQLSNIITVLGCSDKLIGSINTTMSRRLQEMSIRHEREIFKNRFANAPVLAVDLLLRMVQFDPKKRLTVEQCLSHPYMTSVEDKLKERTMIDARFKFDNREDFEVFDLRFCILSEVRKYHPEMEIPIGLQHCCGPRFP